MRYFPLALCAARLACSQTFDVATIKPHPQGADGRIRVMMSGGPGSSDPGRLNYENVSLKDVLTNAFNIRNYQLSGPVWLASERFDLTAKIPAGATKDQFRIMLQNLLTERFGMKVHRETKEMAAYVLVVAKNGPKLKPSEVKPSDQDAASPQPSPEPGRKLQPGKDGFPEMPPGDRGNSVFMMPGKARIISNNAPVSRLIDILANQLDRPIIDATDLKGNYDLTLYFEPEMRSMPGGGMPPREAPGPTSPGPAPAPEGPAYPTLTTAIQEQLGLKLESKKAPVDLVIIDRIEKTPTEN